MNAFILAMAGTTGAADATSGGSMVTTLITFGAIILIFYFLILRPQKKRDKEAKDMLAAIKKGDKIQTIGGIRGTVAVVKEGTVVIKVDDNTRIEFAKNAIASVLDKKAAEAKPAKAEKVEKPAESELKVVEAPAAEGEEKK